MNVAHCKGIVGMKPLVPQQRMTLCRGQQQQRRGAQRAPSTAQPRSPSARAVAMHAAAAMSSRGIAAAAAAAPRWCHQLHHHQRSRQRVGSVPSAVAPAAASAAATVVATTAAASSSPQLLAALTAQPGWDYGLAVAAAAGAALWVGIFKALSSRGALDQKLSRKLVHSTAAPLFVLTWPLFSAAPEARLIAAAVPAVNALRLFLVGAGLVSDPGLVKSTSRSGDAGELLRGPLYYVLVLAGATVAFWRDSPAGLIAVSMMAGGDGLADIVGRRYGAGNPLPWNKGKSWAGSAGMLFGGGLMAMGLIQLFSAAGYLTAYSPAALAPAVFGVALVCTLVESLPVSTVVDDNFSVPAAAMAVSLALLPMAAAAAAMAGGGAGAGAVSGAAAAVADAHATASVPLLSLASAAAPR